MTASSRSPQPLIEIGTSPTPTITVNNTAASETGSARPWARATDQTTTMVNTWMRHPRNTITEPFGPSTTRRASDANLANQREYRQRASSGAILGASKRPSAPASSSHPYATSTTSRYPTSAVSPDGNSRMANPRANNSPAPIARSSTTLITALRQSQPRRGSNQARTPSPATLGSTCAKNTPMAANPIMTVRVTRP